jgi:hypothetical protein
VHPGTPRVGECRYEEISDGGAGRLIDRLCLRPRQSRLRLRIRHGYFPSRGSRGPQDRSPGLAKCSAPEHSS